MKKKEDAISNQDEGDHISPQFPFIIYGLPLTFGKDSGMVLVCILYSMEFRVFFILNEVATLGMRVESTLLFNA